MIEAIVFVAAESVVEQFVAPLEFELGYVVAIGIQLKKKYSCLKMQNF